MSILSRLYKAVACPGRGRTTRIAALSMVITVMAAMSLMAMFGVQMGLAQTGAVPDPSFGHDGQVLTKFVGKHNSILAIVIGPDGSIYAAGSGTKSGHEYGLIAKYTSAGSLDTAFGDGGEITDNNLVTAQAIALQSDGGILVAGASAGAASGGPALALERYTAAGSLDGSFGSGGIVLDTIGPAADFIDSIVVQSNGQILIGGNTVVVVATKHKKQAINGDFALARYNSNGSVDSSFGTNGKVTTDFNGFFDQIRQILVQPDGRIIAAGQAGVPASSLPSAVAPAGSVAVMGFARYNFNGSLDTSFGQQGLVTVAVNGVGTSLASVALDPNGQVVASGATSETLALTRLSSNGSPDASFGFDGQQSFVPLLTKMACVGTTVCNAVFSGATAISFQPDGTILVAGGIGSSILQVFAVSYNQDGTLNTSYGTGGFLTSKFTNRGEINAAAFQPDGKVVLAGGIREADQFKAQFGVGRYTIPGS